MTEDENERPPRLRRLLRRLRGRLGFSATSSCDVVAAGTLSSVGAACTVSACGSALTCSTTFSGSALIGSGVLETGVGVSIT